MSPAFGLPSQDSGFSGCFQKPGTPSEDEEQPYGGSREGCEKVGGEGRTGVGDKLSRGWLSKDCALEAPAPSRGVGVWKETAVFGSAKSELGPVNTCSPIYSVLWVTRWGRGERRINRRRQDRGILWWGAAEGAARWLRAGEGGGGVLSSSSWGETTRGWGPPSGCQVREAGAGRAGWVQVGTGPASLPGPGGGGGAQVRLCLPLGRPEES